MSTKEFITTTQEMYELSQEGQRLTDDLEADFQSFYWAEFDEDYKLREWHTMRRARIQMVIRSLKNAAQEMEIFMHGRDRKLEFVHAWVQDKETKEAVRFTSEPVHPHDAEQIVAQITSGKFRYERIPT